MNIKKLSDHNFDTSKTVLLCCKGPSSIDAPNHVDGKYVAVTTSACNIFERCDFLFANDVEFFETTDIKHVDNVIVPMVMHITQGGKAGVHEGIPAERHVFHQALKNHCDRNIYTYKLFTQEKSPRYRDMDIDPVGDEFLFPPVLSGYHTALHWLIKAGFRTFDIFGVSACGQYNDRTVNENVPKVPRSTGWYQTNYEMGTTILNTYNCNYSIR